jgi:dipeptidyl aminopeptidase/acylaminoacyl peptidase
MRWVSGNRLVFSTAPQNTGVRTVSEIFACDPDGGNMKKIGETEDFALMHTSGAVGLPDASLSEEDVKSIMRNRNFAVVGKLAGDPDHVLVEAIGEPTTPPTVSLGAIESGRPMGPPPPLIPYTTFKVNVHTGKKTQLAEESGFGKYLYDWHGQPRVFREVLERTAKQSFRYRPTAGRWQSMNETWMGPAAQGFTLTPENYFGQRSIPLGIDFDGKSLYFASNVGRDTFGVYTLNLETKERTKLAFEHPRFDLVPLEPEFPLSSTLVFDEHRQRLAGVRAVGTQAFTLWVDPELAALQRVLDKKFPDQTAEILEWDQDRKRFLFCVSGLNEPGVHYIFQRPKNELIEIMRKASWLQGAQLLTATPFAFESPAGVFLTGYLTFPRLVRQDPPPLLVYFSPDFPARVTAEFDREAQILADLGVVVVRINHRGSTGFGAQHRDAIKAGIDRVVIDDVLATIDWLAKKGKINRRRVATMGQGFGGYLALRALQLEPGAFRCGIAIDAPLDLERWLRPATVDDIEQPDKVDFKQEVQRAFFRSGRVPLKELSVLNSAETLTRPVFLLNNLEGTVPEEIVVETSALRGALKRLGRPAEYLELDRDYTLGLPAARANAFRKFDEFFNLNLYNYKTESGEVQEIKDKEADLKPRAPEAKLPRPQP